MAYYTRAEMRAEYERSPFYRQGRTPDQSLQEAISRRQTRTSWEVFLSHAALDKDIVLGIRQKLADEGRSAYVDWIDDPQLDRSNVTVTTANVLRLRMQACRSMIYALSPNASLSKWMPWELGFFDGNKQGQIAVMPIVDSQSDFKGQEYLGLYPSAEKVASSPGVRAGTYIVTKKRDFITLGDFASGKRVL
jgi:hypothetical protein